MANILSIDKQVAIVSALAEGSGIRQIERHDGRSPRHDHAAWYSCWEGLRGPARRQNAESGLPESTVR